MRKLRLNRIGDHVEVKGRDGLFTGVLLEKVDGGWRISPDKPWNGPLTVEAKQILRKVPTATKRDVGSTTSYTQRGANGKWIGSLHHRQVQALVAIRAGLGRKRLRRSQSPFFCDYYLEPEVDVYGIGHGTVSGLEHWGYVEKRDDEGPLRLTAKGDRALDEILALEGASLPPLVTEIAA